MMLKEKHDRYLRWIFAVKDNASFYRAVVQQTNIQPEYWSKKLMFIYRLGRYNYFHSDLTTLRGKFWRKVYQRWNQKTIMGKLNCHIPEQTDIGWGTKIYHPYGIVINSHAKIGQNATLRQHITIGNAGNGSGQASPKIGNRINIGAGAVLVGDIEIGQNVKVGAGAVVTKSFPDDAVLVGVPAKNINTK